MEKLCYFLRSLVTLNCLDLLISIIAEHQGALMMEKRKNIPLTLLGGSVLPCTGTTAPRFIYHEWTLYLKLFIWVESRKVLQFVKPHNSGEICKLSYGYHRLWATDGQSGGRWSCSVVVHEELRILLKRWAHRCSKDEKGCFHLVRGPESTSDLLNSKNKARVKIAEAASGGSPKHTETPSTHSDEWLFLSSAGSVFMQFQYNVGTRGLQKNGLLPVAGLKSVVRLILTKWELKKFMPQSAWSCSIQFTFL